MECQYEMSQEVFEKIKLICILSLVLMSSALIGCQKQPIRTRRRLLVLSILLCVCDAVVLLAEKATCSCKKTVYLKSSVAMLGSLCCSVAKIKRKGVSSRYSVKILLLVLIGSFYLSRVFLQTAEGTGFFTDYLSYVMLT